MLSWKRKRGFTLLEMLVVVVIIVILIAISLPMMINALNTAREAGCLANRRSLMAQLAYEYMLDGRVVAEVDGQVLTEEEAIKYTCPSGGVITYDFHSGVFTMHCSFHTGESIGQKTGVALGGSFADLKTFFTNKTSWENLNGKGIDSAAAHTSGTKANEFYNSLTAEQQELLDDYTWRVTMNAPVEGESDPNGQDASRVRIFFTSNEMFNSVGKNQTIPVCYKYNPSTGLFQYSLSERKTIDKNGQAVLTGNSNLWGALDEEGNFVSGGWMDTLPDDLSNPTGK